jgi:uncharacterized protein YndB with AHSA1/START domain
MTKPDVPLHLDLAFEVPGTPEQVWQAVATANGISAWFLPTEVEEREGGTITVHMGEETSSTGRVTAWDPPRRFAYEEPDWAVLTGHDDAVVSPLATEFLVEARSGGTCVVRIVSSAFGSGADWEQEFFAEMARMWVPFLDNMRLYLVNFPGQRVTSLSAQATLPGDGKQVLSAMREALGAEEVGDVVETRGVIGEVQRLDDMGVLVRLSEPVPGFIGFAAMDQGNGSTWTQIEGYLFSDDAPAYVERERPGWKAWLQSLDPTAA